MKTITVNVSEPVYKDFQKRAKKLGRPAAELVREAMEQYREQWIERGPSVLEIPPVSAGDVLALLSGEDDLLGEMLDAPRR
jgi:hypothetical protein